MTTDKSRADALTDHECEVLEDAACFLHTKAATALRKLLAASPVEQPAAAPIDVQAYRDIAALAAYAEGSKSAEIVNAMRRVMCWLNAPAPSPVDERAAWQTGAPPVKEGSYAGFIVACRRKHDGKVYVFEANYANQYAEELRDDDGEEFTAHGWYDVAQDIHGEYSSVFSKTCGEGDEIIGWQPLPKWSEESARAASANETGTEGVTVAAWMSNEGYVITAAHKQRALAEGGATATTVHPYSVALGRIGAVPAMAAEAVAIYQILTEEGAWLDVPQQVYERTKSDPALTRVVYAAPQANHRGAIIAEVLCMLDGLIKKGPLDEPAHSERNGLVLAFNEVTRLDAHPGQPETTKDFAARHLSSMNWQL
ncbi:hypothetical protein [Burkholderia diffusa]|uniref:hypothetical protein n=1 Tax=Burkholderia diffusa TaxID=488732 RepID=UPI002AAF5678|nr:hypothetical protein [Burkholderia diffusa]